MNINQITVDKIAANAEKAKIVWNLYSHDEKLKEILHLRPTKSGITIVSTLPCAPMRGLEVNDIELAETLRIIAAKKATLLSANPENAKEILKNMKFKGRKNDGFREENAQAMFIKGMILKQEIYEGIHFVASELTLDGDNRFDVLGYKDDVLYIFELKKDRTFDCIKQVSDYVNLVKQNNAAFLNVLSQYPHFSVSGFSSVQGVAVMKYAANATEKLAEEAKEKGIRLWYYEESISIRKMQ